MADKMVTLNLGGMEVQVPQWASEETMNRVVSYMSAQNKTDKDLNKMMSKVGGNLNDLQKV
jgi:predicted secreted Zn-dependent protease